MYQYKCINGLPYRRLCVWGSTGPVSCGPWARVAGVCA